MEIQDIVIIVLAALVLILQAALLALLRKQSGKSKGQDELVNAMLEKSLEKSKQEMQQSIQTGFRDFAGIFTELQKGTTESQDKLLRSMNASVNERLEQMDKRMSSNSMENEQKLESIRKTMNDQLATLRTENAKKLDEMRETVDEKLQKTLEERISKSFTLVSERLEQVYKGLGEMQTLASGVGDLKKILSNVKTRGILGEIQLGSILEQIMASDQYEENVAVRGSSERVEFAIRLPGNDDGIVYLPIDAKFPADTYNVLLDAYESGSKEEIAAAKAQLTRTIKAFAKSIHDKYIEPPYTTDFGIMFLPFEGLYAEVVREGLVETLQREYKVNIAGPTTMAALLNSLQMGFKTLAIQKHSGEVWNILGAIKTEFEKFGKILLATQQRLNQANAELDKLVGVRTRAIQRTLRNVEKLPEQDTTALLGFDAALDEPVFDIEDAE